MKRVNIEKYKTVSFDVFDTLIKRNVLNPIDIFEIVERRYNLTAKTPVFDFSKNRSMVEDQLWREYGSKFTIADIYKGLHKIYGLQTCHILFKLECDTEIKYCVANETVKALFDDAVKLTKNVLIISDMYLEHSTIEQILKKCGVSGYKKLYVSCHIGMSKSSGDLYNYVKGDAKADFNSWLHIGNNRHSDIKMARKKGINTFYIHIFNNHLQWLNMPVIKPHIARRMLQKLGVAKRKQIVLEESIILATANNMLSNNKNALERIGIELLGVLLTGFSNMLLQNMLDHKIKNVFFLARDGLIMKRVFDLIPNNDIGSFYYFASRRALHVPAILYHSDFDSVLSNMWFPKKFPPQFLIKCLGLEDFNVNEALEQAGIIWGKEYSATHYRKLYDILKTQVIENSKKEELAWLEYSKNLFMEKAAIVDIGWFGNMQKSLENLCKNAHIETDFTGFYVCLEHQREDIKMNGYLYEDRAKIPNEKYICTAIIESLLTAEHGSVKRFSQNGDIELYPNKINRKTISEISQVQEAAVRFAEAFYALPLSEKLSIKPNHFLGAFLKLAKFPNREIADMIGEWEHDDVGIKKIAAPQKLSFYLVHPKRFIHDARQTLWRSGFSKRVLGTARAWHLAQFCVNCLENAGIIKEERKSLFR